MVDFFRLFFFMGKVLIVAPCGVADLSVITVIFGLYFKA